MFRVPGLVTRPCNGATHNFTIVELWPQAVMSWVAEAQGEDTSDCAWAGPAFILLVYLETDLSQAHICVRLHAAERHGERVG
jgi:hypothetical protein